MTMAQVQIESVQFYPQNGFTDMFIRPFEANVNEMTLQNIMHTVAQHGTVSGTDITPQLVVNTGTNIIAPAAAHEGVAAIDYGWAARRFSFVVRVNVTMMHISQIIELHGFTDFYDMSHGGHVSGDMIMRLNTYTVIQRQVVNTPHGQTIQEVVAETGYVVNNQLFNGNTGQQVDVYKLRPTDAVTAIETMQFAQAYQQSNPHAPFDDSRNRVLGAETFNRGNVNPATYTAKLLSAATNNINMVQIGQARDVLANNVAQSLAEAPTTNNQFFLAMGQRYQRSNVSFFTLSELLALDPQHGEVAVNEIGALSVVGLQEQNAGWDNMNYDHHVRMATQLANIVPQLSEMAQIPAAHFTATNMTVDGQFQFRFNNVYRTTGASARNYNVLMARMVTEVLPSILPFMGAQVSIDMYYDVKFEAVMTIDIYGFDSITLRAPVFASVLFNPLVTTNLNNLFTMAQQVETVIGGVSQVLQENAKQPQGFAY